MRAVGAVNCDPPGGARVSVVPLLTPRKSCGGGACGLPGRGAGAEVQGANDGVGWSPGRGGLRENHGFPLCPRMLCNVVAGSHRPRAGAAAASPHTLQVLCARPLKVHLKLRDAGRDHHPCAVCVRWRARVPAVCHANDRASCSSLCWRVYAAAAARHARHSAVHLRAGYLGAHRRCRTAPTANHTAHGASAHRAPAPRPGRACVAACKAADHPTAAPTTAPVALHIAAERG